MKLLRYGPAGQEKPGVIDRDGKIRDLSGHLRDLDGAALAPASLDKLRAIDPAGLPLVPGTPRLGPCVANVPKFICIGLNYTDHAAETGAETPKEPIIFTKAISAIVGPDDDVMLPRGSVKTDWEVELGIVIGQVTRYVNETEARAHIAGYCVVNDVSEREYQIERGGTWTKGKSADTFGPMGPWMVTADEIPDPGALPLWTEVNGKRVQNGTTANLIFGIEKIVSYVSHFMTLSPGDIIATGTPAGVGLGMKPPMFLKAGDTMRLGVEGLGVQNQRVVAFKL